MFFSYKSFLYHIVGSLIITATIVASDAIPTMIWNIKGNSLHFKPVPALGVNDKMLIENLKDIHHQESSILVFAVNKLSLEDFSAKDKPQLNNTVHNIESFLDSQPHMILPTVTDPLNYIHKARCGVQEIVVDNKIDENIMQLVSSAMQRSCVVILHITDDGVVKDELNSVFLPSFENSNKNIVGIFTGVKSSWGSPDSERHVFRNLLQVDQTDDNFVNVSNCLIMYAENASITIGKEGNGTVNLPFPVDFDGSSCGNNSVLQLKFTTSGIISSVTIKLDFPKIRGAWETTGTVSVTGYKGDKPLVDEMDLNTESVGASMGFSYSCGDLVLKSKNSTFGITIKFIGFQVQPYQVKDAFSESFDCVPYFTVPIWMGVFVSLLFIIIANIGIYALFSVHTMDRFDDPKGKTISVAAAAD